MRNRHRNTCQYILFDGRTNRKKVFFSLSLSFSVLLSHVNEWNENYHRNGSDSTTLSSVESWRATRTSTHTHTYIYTRGRRAIGEKNTTRGRTIIINKINNTNIKIARPSFRNWNVRVSETSVNECGKTGAHKRVREREPEQHGALCGVRVPVYRYSNLREKLYIPHFISLNCCRWRKQAPS